MSVNNIIVVRNKIQEDATLKILEEKGYMWSSRSCPTHNRYLKDNEVMLLYLYDGKILRKETLSFHKASLDYTYSREYNMRVLEVKDLKEILS